MFGKKLKISDELWERLELAAKVKGVASVDEFVAHLLGSEVDRILSEAGKGQVSAAELDDITNKLKGLGYLE